MVRGRCLVHEEVAEPPFTVTEEPPASTVLPSVEILVGPLEQRGLSAADALPSGGLRPSPRWLTYTTAVAKLPSHHRTPLDAVLHAGSRQRQWPRFPVPLLRARKHLCVRS